MFLKLNYEACSWISSIYEQTQYTISLSLSQQDFAVLHLCMMLLFQDPVVQHSRGGQICVSNTTFPVVLFHPVS